MDNLLDLMDRLERRDLLAAAARLCGWLSGFIGSAKAAVALKELEYLGRPSAGPLTERTEVLADHILEQLETATRTGKRQQVSVPERVKQVCPAKPCSTCNDTAQ